MDIEAIANADLNAAVAFVDRAAPSLEQSLVGDFNDAVAKLKAAFTPVSDAAIIAAVGLLTSKFALNAPFSAAEIEFLEGVVAHIQTMISTSRATA